MMKILGIVGARPNFVKMAPIAKEIERTAFADFKLVHTGQHYDDSMSKVFFDELGMPKPDIWLGVGSASHSKQTARIMSKLEDVMIDEGPDLVIIVGDVNSTLAASLVCAKMGIKLAHVEAGLRSFDTDMPEEINRIIADRLSDLLFVTEKSGMTNLEKEGIRSENAYLVGNVMVDSLLNNITKAESTGIIKSLSLDGPYALMTIHRPSNVDDPMNFAKIIDILESVSSKIPVVFPLHPRTRKRMEEYGLQLDNPNIISTPPLGYLDFLNLMNESTVVLTDSGGIQEETSVLGVPCLTLRENTERPITVELGTNEIVGLDKGKILACVRDILTGSWKKGEIPPLWDGKASERIVQTIRDKYGH